MPNNRPTRQRAVLKYPSHQFKPEELLSFIELRPFTRQWDSMDLTDTDLAALQIILMTAPTGSPVIEGTGGLRKLRFSPPKMATGKRGGLRVWYTYIEEAGIIILAFVYEKIEREDLNENEKKAVRKIVEKAREDIFTQTSSLQS